MRRGDAGQWDDRRKRRDRRSTRWSAARRLTDNIATVTVGQPVAAGVEKEFGEVRMETFDGGHSLSTDHLKTALGWFLEAGEDRRQMIDARSGGRCRFPRFGFL